MCHLQCFCGVLRICILCESVAVAESLLKSYCLLCRVHVWIVQAPFAQKQTKLRVKQASSKVFVMVSESVMCISGIQISVSRELTPECRSRSKFDNLRDCSLSVQFGSKPLCNCFIPRHLGHPETEFPEQLCQWAGSRCTSLTRWPSRRVRLECSLG